MLTLDLRAGCIKVTTIVTLGMPVAYRVIQKKETNKNLMIKPYSTDEIRTNGGFGEFDKLYPKPCCILTKNLIKIYECIHITSGRLNFN